VVNAQQRRFLWERSISEYQYMISNSKPTMVLLPEIYFKMGESYLELGRLSDAQLAFESARTLKPDYWPAYTRWIDELLKLKQFATAREVAEEGLRQLPDHPELRVRLEHALAGMGSRAPR
jgi:tetratricopeptide (TPR) repeat protein